MKEVIKEVLGYQVPIQEYATLGELVAAAGGEEKALAKFNTFLHYHGSYADARSLLADCTEEVSGVKRIESDTGRKNAEGKPITELESEKKFSARVLASKPEVQAKVQALITQRAKGYTYKDENGVEQKVPAIAADASDRVRVSATKKCPKKFLDIAQSFLTGEKKDKLQKLVATMVKDGIQKFEPVPNVQLGDAQNITKLGWLCKAWSDLQDPFSKA